MTPIESVLLSLVFSFTLALIFGWFITLWVVRCIVKFYTQRPCCTPPSLNVLIQKDGVIRRADADEDEDEDHDTNEEDDEL